MGAIEMIREALRRQQPSVAEVEKLLSDANAEVGAAGLAYDSDPSTSNEKRLLAARQTVDLAGVRLRGAQARAAEQARKEAAEASERASRAHEEALARFCADADRIPAMISELADLHIQARRAIDERVNAIVELYNRAQTLEADRDIPRVPALRAMVRSAIRRRLLDEHLYEAEDVRGAAVSEWLTPDGGL